MWERLESMSREKSDYMSETWENNLTLLDLLANRLGMLVNSFVD